MNQVVYAYRVWRVEHVDYGYVARYSLNRALTKTQLRHLFNLEKSAKLTPILDKRMKNGGRKML